MYHEELKVITVFQSEDFETEGGHLVTVHMETFSPGRHSGRGLSFEAVPKGL